MKISIVSDVPWGYGSPQIDYFRKSLQENNIEVQYLVPTYSNRPLLTSIGATQVFSEGSPFTWEGMVAFGKRAALEIEIFNPDKIVLVNPRSLALLPFLRSRFVSLIYYGLEPVLDHGENFLKSISIQKFNFDLAIFPNLERANQDGHFLAVPTDRIRIIRNVPMLSKTEPTIEVSKTVTYAGSLDSDWVDFAVLEGAATFAPLKIWGHTDSKLPLTLSHAYQGNLPHSRIQSAYSDTVLSLVIWKPINFGTRNASPNKFFEALSFGIPSVSYPYPQLLQIATKYGVGYIAEDFSSQSFIRILKSAYEHVESAQFKEMRELCLNLHRTRFNWELESQPVIQELV